MIEVTDSAKAKLGEYLSENAPEAAIRVVLQQGG
jgi:Fe-S cluster assembly iron-binding protein IscA